MSGEGHEVDASTLDHVMTDDEGNDHPTSCDDHNNADSPCDDEANVDQYADHNNTGHDHDSQPHEVIEVASEERVLMRESIVEEDQSRIRHDDEDDLLIVMNGNEDDDLLIVMNDEDDFDTDDDNIAHKIGNDVDVMFIDVLNQSDVSEHVHEELDNSDIMNVRDNAYDAGDEEDGRHCRTLSPSELRSKADEATEDNVYDDGSENDDVGLPINNENAVGEEVNREMVQAGNDDNGNGASDNPVSRRPWNERGRYGVEILANTGIYIDKRELLKIKSKYATRPADMERALLKKIIGEDLLKTMTRTGRHQKGSVRERFPQDVLIAVKGM